MLRGIKGLILSMLTVFKHLFKNKVTLEYPEKKILPPENFRGKPYVENCIKCMTCTKVCPAGAITITEDKFSINMNKCIFCGNCAFYCPVKAIKMGKDYELAADKKDMLTLVYDITGKEGE